MGHKRTHHPTRTCSHAAGHRGSRRAREPTSPASRARAGARAAAAIGRRSGDADSGPRTPRASPPLPCCSGYGLSPCGRSRPGQARPGRSGGIASGKHSAPPRAADSTRVQQQSRQRQHEQRAPAPTARAAGTSANRPRQHRRQQVGSHFAISKYCGSDPFHHHHCWRRCSCHYELSLLLLQHGSMFNISK